MPLIKILLIFKITLGCITVSASPSLSGNQKISSQHLGYALQFRVYTPHLADTNMKLPTLYVTDGHWYIEQGKLPEVLGKMIADNLIEPVVVVFVDSRNPNKLSKNRRRELFFCNTQFVDFFKQELIPQIEKYYPVVRNRDSRTILGLSFGGYNSACFGLMAHDTFSGIAMQSPARVKMIKEISERYIETKKLPLKIFLSYGNRSDGRNQGRKFRDILLAKGYDVTYKEVRTGHNWANWGPLQLDVLKTFFGKVDSK